MNSFDRRLLPRGEITRSPQSGSVTATALNQVTTTSTYDEHRDVSSYSALYSGALVFGYSVTQRDGQGRILEVSENSPGGTVAKSYRYDALGRLREVLVDGTTSAIYTYTSNGNRHTRQRTAETLTAIYDTQDRIDSYGDCDYTVDSAGFLTERDCDDGSDSFQYDARGALRQVVLAGGDTIQYVIDARGRRIGRRVNGALDKGWIYLDGLRPAAQLNSAGQIEAVYVYGTHASVPEYIVEKTGGADVIYRVLVDHLGTPRRVVRTSDGLVVHELDVDEWGNVTRETGSILSLHPFGFAGGLRDRDTGLIRFGARDYDPYAGRWTARDPLLFGGAQTNLYGYVGNDPVNRVDRLGLFFCNYTGDPIVVGGGTGAGRGHTGDFGTGTLPPGQCVGPNAPLDTPQGPLFDVDVADFNGDGTVDAPMSFFDSWPLGEKIPLGDSDTLGYCALNVSPFSGSTPVPITTTDVTPMQ